MRRPSSLIRIAVAATALAYTTGLYYSGAQLVTPWSRILSALPLAATVLLWLWDALIWRIPIFLKATKRPYLQGLWAVSYAPTDESHIPEGGNRGPIPGYLQIRQTFWWITVRSYTVESKSDSRSFFWDLRPGNDFATLIFTYENQPRASESHRSTRHLGTTQLDTTAARPRVVEGVYFTDRYTKGDMRISLVDRTLGYASFQEADDHSKAVKSK